MMAPDKPSLDQPTPKPEADQEEEQEEDQEMIDIDLDDSAVLTPENMKALLSRAKSAGQDAAKKTRQAFDTTKALADTGMLRITSFHKKKSSNGA